MLSGRMGMARWKDAVSALGLALGLLASAAPVKAALIPISDPRFGPNSLIFDSNTGM